MNKTALKWIVIVVITGASLVVIMRRKLFLNNKERLFEKSSTPTFSPSSSEKIEFTFTPTASLTPTANSNTPTGIKTITETVTNSPIVASISGRQANEEFNLKVMVLNFNPALNNGKKVIEHYGWHEPRDMSDSYIAFFEKVSRGRLHYKIVKHIEVDEFPVKKDGFLYNAETYLKCVAQKGEACHSHDLVDYQKIIADFDICNRANRGEIDEVWLFGGPWFGYWESNLTGPGAYFLNSPPTLGTACKKLLPIMGMNYERFDDRGGHIWGHRMESTMTKLYGSWEENRMMHSWDMYGLVESQSMDYGYSGCGSIHYPPNATKDYEYNSRQIAASYCGVFQRYPKIRQYERYLENINCQSWGCTGEGYYTWWFKNLPYFQGVGEDGKLNDWWQYLANPEKAL